MTQDNDLITVTKIAKALSFEAHTLEAKEINKILEGLRWQAMGPNGWLPELKALDIGAKPSVYGKRNYLLWPSSLLHHPQFLEAVADYLSPEEDPKPTTKKKSRSFRETYRLGANFRTNDGHYVRSKAEAMIDNWLYKHGIVHAYESRLPVAEEVYCDFYLPTQDLYIEYWGVSDNPDYEERKRAKQALYQAQGFRLLELTDEHITQLDDVLSQLLLQR